MYAVATTTNSPSPLLRIKKTRSAPKLETEALSMAVEAQHLHHFNIDFAEGQAVCSDAAAAAAPSRKRHRSATDVDDCIVFQHYEKIRAEMERRRRFEMQVMMLAEERASKKLRAKDEEIEQMKNLNWALEENIKKLTDENQIWRYLAQTNEAAANALRAHLEHALAEQARAEEERALAAAAEGDAESSCCGDNLRDVVGGWRRLCRSCTGDEPSVMLLPCRHLCLCQTCARATDACPICQCRKSGTVNVNLS